MNFLLLLTFFNVTLEALHHICGYMVFLLDSALSAN